MRRMIQRFPKNNRGFTLVELLVTIAILGFVLLAAGGALVTSAKNYKSGTVEVNLQQQSQITANLISNLVLDASNVSFVGNKLEIKQKQGPDEVVYTIEKKHNATKNINELVYSVTGTSIVGEDTDQLLAENVTDTGFVVDTTDFSKTKNVAVTLEFEEAGKTFKTTYNMTARNGNGDGSTALLAVRDVVLEPGEEYTFTSVSNRSLTWSVVSGSTCGSTMGMVGNDAKISVSKTETASILQYQATTVPVDPSETAVSDIVNVYIRRVGSVDLVGSYDAGQYDAGTTYTIVPDFTLSSLNTNLKTVPNAVNGGYNYREFEEVEWSIKEDSYNLIAPGSWNPKNFTNDSAATVCSAKLTLVRNMNVGEKIVIQARAYRPGHDGHTLNGVAIAKGYGTPSNPDTGEVIGEYVIERKADIRRGWFYDFPKIPDERVMVGGEQKHYFLRIGNAGMLNKDDPATWSGCDWDSDGGVDSGNKYRFQAPRFNAMDPTQEYLIQFAFSWSDENCGDQKSNAKARIYNYTDAEFDKYVQTYKIGIASFNLERVIRPDGSIDSSILGKEGLGVSGGGYPISRAGETKIQLETLAHSSNFFRDHLKYKIYKKNGASYEEVNVNCINFSVYDDGSKGGELKFSDLRNYGFVAGDEIMIVFDWEPGIIIDHTRHFYNNTTGAGIFYLSITN